MIVQWLTTLGLGRDGFRKESSGRTLEQARFEQGLERLCLITVHHLIPAAGGWELSPSRLADRNLGLGCSSGFSARLE